MLYDLAFFIFSIFYLPALIFKGKLHGDFAERFGRFGGEKRKELEGATGAIWIQAVSVGEVALLKGFIPELNRRFPDKRIVLSTITKTGNDLAKKLFSDRAIVIYFPLDFSFVVKKVIALIQPCLYVMIETEIWPNLLRELSAHRIPSILINGRISDRSFGKYRLARPFLRKTIEVIDLFCMQSHVDVARIEYLGAPKERVRMTGNMKLDTDVGVDEKNVVQMREKLDLKPGHQLIVAGSTHNGEEEAILGVFRELLEEFPTLRLLIAPRHIERAGEIDAAVSRFGFDPVRMSRPKRSTAHSPRTTVFVLDTIGQLRDAYALASIVFIGGSLAKHGGQNPIEPAVLARPILFGPHMFNFKDVRRMLLDANAAVEVEDKEGLTKKIRLLLIDDQERERMGSSARRVIGENRGATSKNLEAIQELIMKEAK